MFPIQKMLVQGFPQSPMVGVYGIVIHDTADTAPAIAHATRVQSPSAYNNGITTFWCDEGTTYQTVPDGITAYHLGVYSENQKYIGIEVCRSRSDESLYLKALQNAYELAKYLCDVYGLSYDKIFHHKQFYATACPHRRYEIFGANALAVDRTNVANAGTAPTPPKEETDMPVFKEEINAPRCLVEFTKGRGVYAGAGDNQFKYYDIPVGAQRVIFPNPTKNGIFLWSLAINPDNINDSGFIAIYENDNPTFKVLKKGYNFEVAPPKPIKLSKLEKPFKVALKTSLYQCRVDKDKVIEDKVKPLYEKGSILEVNYFVDYNNIKYYFKDEKGLVGTSLGRLPIDEAKTNLLVLGKEI